MILHPEDLRYWSFWCLAFIVWLICTRIWLINPILHAVKRLEQLLGG